MRREELATSVTEYLLENGTRSAMRRTIGDKTPAQYDRADKVAEGVGVAVVRLLSDPKAADLRAALKEAL